MDYGKWCRLSDTWWWRKMRVGTLKLSLTVYRPDGKCVGFYYWALCDCGHIQEQRQLKPHSSGEIYICGDVATSELLAKRAATKAAKEYAEKLNNPSAIQFRKWQEEYADDPEYIAYGLLSEVTEAICGVLVEEGIQPEDMIAELSARTGFSRRRVRRFLNTPANTTVLSIVQFTQAVGLTVGIELVQNEESKN